MTLEEFRSEMWKYRNEARAEAQRCKDPMHTYRALETLYSKFDEGEREMADIVLAEWLLSCEASLRTDALALIQDFRIESTRAALNELARRLSRSPDPGAPYELIWVGEILAGLRAQAPPA